MRDATRHYDVVVIGAGSGNTVIDERFGDRSVAIVEPGPMGGTCLNRGCIPSKMYVHASDLLRDALRGPALGVRTEAHGADWTRLRARVVGRIDDEAAAGRRGRENAVDLDLLTGTAQFTRPRQLTVSPADGGAPVTITADQVVIAVGSRPVVPDLPGLHDVEHHTSDTIMRLERQPLRLAVLGGGYVGCEFAHVFSACGTEVVQVEVGPHLLGDADEEVSTRFTTSVPWEVRTATEVDRVTRLPDGDARLHFSDGTTTDVDLVLVATGRRPNGDTLHLDRAGVDVDDQGRVVVDARQRTSAEGVWALGDACTGVPLKHVANHEARTVQHNLLHPDDQVESTHEFVPRAVFSHPPSAAVGLTEEKARESGIDLAVGRGEYVDTAFGWAMQSGPDDHPAAAGFVKVLADRATGRLVGAHVLGSQASLLIQPLVTACAFGLEARSLARGQYWTHPALVEVVEAALLDLADDL